MVHTIKTPDWLTLAEVREISLTAQSGSKLQAIKDFRTICENKLGKGHCWGLKECKEFVEQLPTIQEDPILDVQLKIETIERMLKEIPLLLVLGMPSITSEQAKALCSKVDLEDLKKRCCTAELATKFGI